MPIRLNKREVKKTKVEELKKALIVGADWTPTNFHWKNDENFGFWEGFLVFGMWEKKQKSLFWKVLCWQWH